MFTLKYFENIIEKRFVGLIPSARCVLPLWPSKNVTTKGKSGSSRSFSVLAQLVEKFCWCKNLREPAKFYILSFSGRGRYRLFRATTNRARLVSSYRLYTNFCQLALSLSILTPTI